MALIFFKIFRPKIVCKTLPKVAIKMKRFPSIAPKTNLFPSKISGDKIINNTPAKAINIPDKTLNFGFSLKKNIDNR